MQYLGKLNKTFKDKIPTFSRLAIFLIYFWFGALKLFGESPATEIVTDLQRMTIPFIDEGLFLILIGLAEVFIGIMFLFKRFTKYTMLLFIPHMLTTLLPLVFLASSTWSGFLIPTMEGQYIIKNIVLIALGLEILREHHYSNIK